jgi:hypothetical protein
MSNPSPFHAACLSISPPQQVILKGFTGEPIKLLAIHDRGDSIEVAHDIHDEPMPFHNDSVFVFDAGLFNELQSAADVDDEAKLARAWSKATPFRAKVA